MNYHTVKVCVPQFSHCRPTEPKHSLNLFYFSARIEKINPVWYRSYSFICLSSSNPFRNKGIIHIYTNPRICLSWVENFMPIKCMAKENFQLVATGKSYTPSMFIQSLMKDSNMFCSDWQFDGRGVWTCLESLMVFYPETFYSDKTSMDSSKSSREPSVITTINVDVLSRLGGQVAWIWFNCSGLYRM
jgi:hypothetical protein